MISVAAIICVRMSSDRLPGKALLSYHPQGNPNLECIINRVFTSRHSPKVVVATSTDKTDDPIEKWVRDNSENVHLYRGNLNNVVERFDFALREYVPEAKFIWRVMGDCPLLDVGLNDWRTDVLHRTGADAMLIVGPEPTYAAMGSVWSREAWDWCAKNSSGSLLQHPGEAIWQSNGQFRIVRDPGPESIYYLPVRTELDTEEDLEFFRRVWSEYPRSLRDIELATGGLNTRHVLTWLSSQPNLIKINQNVVEKTHYAPAHGHPRARRVICENCREVIGHRFNDKLVLRCSSCGETRDYY